MFFTPAEARIGYQEVSHLFASLIKHGGNYAPTSQERRETEAGASTTQPATTAEIEAFLIEVN